MMLSLAAIPGASDLGADGLVLYAWGYMYPRPEIVSPDGYEPVGPLVIVMHDQSGDGYLWGRAFAPTADEQARRCEIARKEEEDARELAKASRAAQARQRLDALWTLAGHSGDCPPLDGLLLREMRPMLRKIGKPYGGNVRSWEAVGVLHRWAEAE